MEREFIILPEFDKKWKSFGLNDEDLSELQFFLCLHPDYGDVIEGTGGLRKIRWKIKGKGKSGVIRFLYINFVRFEKIYFITAFKKSEQENITDSQKKEIKKRINLLENELKEKERNKHEK